MAFFKGLTPRRAGWAAAGILLVLLLAAGLAGLGPVSEEARVRDVVCLRLLANTTDGRQALVSSVWWPPLPTLVRLPLVFLLRTETPPAASLIVSALFGVCALVLLGRVLSLWNLGRQRLLVVVGVAANPFFLAECLNGSSTTLIAFLVLLVAYGLALWTRERKLRGLTLLGLGSALLLISSLEMGIWALAVLGLLAAYELVRPATRNEREAVLILALFPAAYAVGLWALTNWLIMGNPLYFLRSLVAPGPEKGVLSLTALGSHAGLYMFAGMAVVLLAVAASTRDKAGLCLGAAGVAPVGVAVLLACRHWFWDASPVLFSLIPLGAAGWGHVLDRCRASSARLGAALAAVPPLVAAAAWAMTGGGADCLATTDAASRGVSEGANWLPRIERQVLRSSRFAKVFVCGYGSFSLLGTRSGELFVHSLDFNFYRAAEDYVGHSLYLLVHRPVGRMAMDSIYWQYSDLFTLGARSTLYYGDWGDWRLFEIIQAPREIPAGE